MAVHHWNPHETVFAVVDIETTGLSAGRDRIIELSVVRVGADGQIKLVLDTLVNPDRPVEWTSLHGIDDQDVAAAPKFEQVASRFLRATESAVVVGHNVEFDLRFLRWELARVGWQLQIPYIDTMAIGRALHLCDRVSLDEACTQANVHRLDKRHSAAVDAMDTAKLLVAYKRTMERLGIASLGGLVSDCNALFVESLRFDPILPGEKLPWPDDGPAVARFDHRGQSEIDLAYRTYFCALMQVLVDLELSAEEATRLAELQQRLRLDEDMVRALHAQAFAGAIMQFVMDQRLDDSERDYLRRLHRCLESAGWAPGA